MSQTSKETSNPHQQKIQSAKWKFNWKLENFCPIQKSRENIALTSNQLELRLCLVASLVEYIRVDLEKGPWAYQETISASLEATLVVSTNTTLQLPQKIS